MPKILGNLGVISPLLTLPFCVNGNTHLHRSPLHPSKPKGLALKSQRVWTLSGCYAARRRVRYEEDEEEYGYNEEIAELESYSQSAREEALLVHAVVGEIDVDVVVFKGFSSCLSYSTSPDPTRSVLPARAMIKSIDRVKGPFDPSNIEYLQRGLTWETFKKDFLS